MGVIPPNLLKSGAVEIAKILKTISGGNVLDVASGDGDFIAMLIDALKDYESFTGIDSNKKEMEKAKKNLVGKSVKIHLMNAEKLRFDNNKFDFVSIANSLHHLENMNEVLAEMKRVLKPGGYFIIQEMFCDGNQTEAQKTDITSHTLGAEIDNMLGIYNQKTYTKKTIMGIIEELNLREFQVYESSRYVKCLFCSDNQQCEDPLNENLINFAINELEENIAQVKESSEYDRLVERKEIIKQNIMKYGSAPASILFCIGRK
ncbi:MAG: class I SAM-dependent methyltransferase [Candidatus Heimdallarchaeota archaeon]|nr:MAG: class I SAM-dependent methyltransferase [Candidatus Heimdallarchaeota archaeon]